MWIFSPSPIHTIDGFNCLLQKIRDCAAPQDKMKVGLDATGHYSCNLFGFLLESGLPTYVLNPLRTNLYRKGLSLRKTKTDRVAARTIAVMPLSDGSLKPYIDTAYHNEELKLLIRYRFDKVKERSKLKSSISRLVCILFPELEQLLPTLHIASVYALLEAFPGAKQVAGAHLTRLKTLLETASKGRCKQDTTLEIRNAARNSIGSRTPAKSLKLQHTIRLIWELDTDVEEIEEQIQAIMNELHSPITTIPDIGFRMAAMIIAEVGDFSRFDSTSCWPTLECRLLLTSLGSSKNRYPHMEKRGSRYLHYALYNATKYVCHWGPTFAAYLAKKRAEGKHYNVALSHASKKLIRLRFAMEKSRMTYYLTA